MVLQIGDKAPSFSLKNTNGKLRTLKEFSGKWLVIYFYPKDDTSGCTKQACSIRDKYSKLENAEITILGVSPDSVESHQKFTKKYTLPFELLVDEDHKLAEAYGVWVKKKMYGREYMGIKRTTFIVDKNEMIFQIIADVNVDDHATQILDAIKK